MPSPKSTGARHEAEKRVSNVLPPEADLCVMVDITGSLGGPPVGGGGVVVVLNRAGVEVELS